MFLLGGTKDGLDEDKKWRGNAGIKYFYRTQKFLLHFDFCCINIPDCQHEGGAASNHIVPVVIIRRSIRERLLDEGLRHVGIFRKNLPPVSIP